MKEEKKNVLILTEGGLNIGFGHVSRCLSLYQAFEARNYYLQILVAGDDSVSSVLGDHRFLVFNWLEQEDQCLEQVETADAVIIDSYLAKLDTYRKIARKAKRSIFLDDNCRLEYPPGMVINWNIYAKELKYPVNDSISYLLGPDFICLRKAFWDVPNRVTKRQVEEVLITFGGDDSKNLTPDTLKLLVTTCPQVKKNVVIGRAFKNLRQIEAASDNNTELIDSPHDQEMKDLMIKSDIAISSGGQTLYELARLGLPAIVVAVAPNQQENVRGWGETEFILSAGFWQDSDLIKKIKNKLQIFNSYSKRTEASKIGMSIINGNGAFRIIDCMEKNM